jgi:hypothetical protein
MSSVSSCKWVQQLKKRMQLRFGRLEMGLAAKEGITVKIWQG